MTEPAVFLDDKILRIGDAEFFCAFPFGNAPAGMLEVMKPRELVEQYFQLGERLQPKRIFELGINRGGSTGMLATMFEPERHVAIELARQRVALLDAFLEEHGLSAAVRAHYGVDQADRARLAEIVDLEFGDSPLDLVVDDASHLYEETRSSFESLFPRLRPGGLFVIEDWCWLDHFAVGMNRALSETTDDSERVREAIVARMSEREAGRGQRLTPLSRLALELVLARAVAGEAIESITIDVRWIAVERGTAPLDRESFRIADLYDDQFGQLAPPE
jgi:predicted O-methyltransferase YrrM